MSVVELSKQRQEIGTTLDNVAIVNCLECAPVGGVVLDFEGYPSPIVKAGHVIIRHTESGKYKPLGLNAEGTQYQSLPSGYKVAGVLYASTANHTPSASVMVRGTINRHAVPYPIDEALAQALPLILLAED